MNILESHSQEHSGYILGGQGKGKGKDGGQGGGGGQGKGRSQGRDEDGDGEAEARGEMETREMIVGPSKGAAGQGWGLAAALWTEACVSGGMLVWPWRNTCLFTLLTSAI